MKTLMILTLAILLAVSSRADYGAYQLSHLIASADFAAIGKIVKVDKNYFYFQVKEYILNSLKLDTIAILKFEDWACAQRYQAYKVGQIELVFFQKSNYALDDYEILGYGAGDEFELPIFGDSIMYQGKFPRKQMYTYSSIVQVIKDYNKLLEPIRGTSKLIPESEKLSFSGKSNLHSQIIEYYTSYTSRDYDISTQGVIVNLEHNYLYEGYENKIYLSSNLNRDSIFLSADDAQIRAVNNYFIITPKSSSPSRWINVMWYNSNHRENLS
jgi:hypothetical protein